MNEAIKRFGSYLQRRYGDRSTPLHYLSDMRIFVQYIGDKAPQEVGVADIDSFIDHQAGRGLKSTTINRRLATLHTFFEFLSSEDPDRARPNPVNWRRHKVAEGETLPRDIPDWAVERLSATIDDDRDRAIFGLMLNAGLRVGEVVSLRLSDLEAPSSPDQMARLRVRGKGRKERMAWLIPSLYQAIQTWQKKRPASSSEHLFLNQHGRSLSKAGVQYRLRQYATSAGLRVTCHQLRHTFARRLAEQEMPIESLSKLLGHAQVQTTQIYTAGADPKLQAAFAQTMARLESMRPPQPQLEQQASEGSLPSPKEERSDPKQLDAYLALFDALPEWLRLSLQAFLTRRWRNWQPHMAARHARRLTQQLVRTWNQLLNQQTLNAWTDLRRSHLETWLTARDESGIAASSRTNELSELLSFLRFVADQGISLDANIFRVAYPERPVGLPRFLPEADYRRLERFVLSQTADDSPISARDRAWFFFLAHTGLRVSELLNLRVHDFDLSTGLVTVRGGKNIRDRVVYLTPALSQVLQTYLRHRKAVADDHLWLDDESPLQDHKVRYRLRYWGELCEVEVTPHRLRHTLWRPFGRLVNISLDMARCQERVSLPWRLGTPSSPEPVSFQGT